MLEGLRETAHDSDDEQPKISALDPKFAGPNGKPDEKKIAAYIESWEDAKRRAKGGNGHSRYDESLCSLGGQLIHEASVAKASNFLAWPRGERYDEIPLWKWLLYTRYWESVTPRT